ncbi:MAG: homoserine dehydrogenase, partial [Euryarchaeota archaeon]|nr:homoserine dehydrogenase [Euryarchaeota archaeon]
MKISLVGFGTVGQGLTSVLIKKRDFLKEKYGLEPKVVAISDSSGAATSEKGLDLERALEIKQKSGAIALYPDFGKKGVNGVQVIEKIPSDVVIEVTPTNIETGEPGMSHLIAAMKNKRHVITSNKGPLALAYGKLKRLANENKVFFRYEAAVGGAMPIINLARETLAGNQIYSFKGILNGTTNYILSRMAKEGTPFDLVLREAQEMGIAESDPSLDIKGIDTACKLIIIANAILGLEATYRDVKPLEGIRRVTLDAINLARESGYIIKLIGEVSNSKIEVTPRLVPVGHPLSVGGTLNVATFETDLAGEITIVGSGAGAKEAASAILGDLI